MSAMLPVSSLLLFGAGLTLSATVWARSTQPAAPAAAYSYTSAQAEFGKAVYAAHCAACHGANMQGTDDGMDAAPPLVGPRFDTHWRANPQALYSKIKRSMPQDDPGILSKDQAVEVVAYILRANKVGARP